MAEHLKQILDILKEKPELQEKLKNANSLEEAYEVVGAAQSEYSMDEFKAAMEELKEAAELSDEDLDSVAGGFKLTSTSILSRINPSVMELIKKDPSLSKQMIEMLAKFI